jgi:hypothetical protein
LWQAAPREKARRVLALGITQGPEWQSGGNVREEVLKEACGEKIQPNFT